MPNIVFKLGALDLSNYLRVAPDAHFDPAQGAMIDPAWSDSPFFEGQILTSMDVKNKEMQVPLYLHPATAPYTNDALNALVQQVNQQLRLVTDLGQTLHVQWQNAQASKPTFFTLQFGRFEPDFNFRVSEKGWLAGNLHLWVLPYGHTATERSLGTYAAPAAQSGMVVQPASMIAAGGSAVGDAPPQWDLRITTPSAIGDDGRLAIIAALPQPGYNPVVTPSSFIGLSASAALAAASGAWATSILEMDVSAAAGASGAPGYFSVALSPATVYQGDNRVLGLVRARFSPFGLRAFDSLGVPLGPTVVASALDGWQVVDYGVLRVPPWQATAVLSVQAYGGIDYTASGQFAPRRAAPAWTKEHGPLFIVPNNSTLFDLDFNSQTLSIDGFDGGASGTVLGTDELGNTWFSAAPTSAWPLKYSGLGGVVGPTGFPGMFAGGAPIDLYHNFEIESLVTLGGSLINGQNFWVSAMPSAVSASGVNGAYSPGEIRAVVYTASQPGLLIQLDGGKLGAALVPTLLPGQYHLGLVVNDRNVRAYLYGPSGINLGSPQPIVATQDLASVIGAYPRQATMLYPGFGLTPTAGATVVVEAFRARTIASTGAQPRDIIHLNQPLGQNTRGTPSGVEVVDLQGRQRGALQSLTLSSPSLGAGFFAAVFPFDQGPANDLLNVEVRIRERFTYAR